MTKAEPKFQRDHARRLLKAGNPEQAMAYMTRLALKGDVAAMIALADHERGLGRQDRSLDWMRQAEQSLKPDDLDAKVDLISAYQLGLGSDDYTVRESRAIELLGELADAGNVIAAHTLMSYYLHGLNGADISREKFEHWARIAAQNGSEGAATALSRMGDWPNVAPR